MFVGLHLFQYMEDIFKVIYLCMYVAGILQFKMFGNPKHSKQSTTTMLLNLILRLPRYHLWHIFFLSVVHRDMYIKCPLFGHVEGHPVSSKETKTSGDQGVTLGYAERKRPYNFCLSMVAPPSLSKSRDVLRSTCVKFFIQNWHKMHFIETIQQNLEQAFPTRCNIAAVVASIILL